MNNKRSGFRGFGVYLILVLAVIAIWYWLDGNNVTNTYTRQQFETALAEGSVTQVNIVPNREVPTGSVNITFSDSSTQVMLVSDVAEIEQYMRDAGFKTYTVQNPPEESWLLTLLPYLIIFAAMFIFFMIMQSTALVSEFLSFSDMTSSTEQGPDSLKISEYHAPGTLKPQKKWQEFLPQKHPHSVWHGHFHQCATSQRNHAGDACLKAPEKTHIFPARCRQPWFAATREMTFPPETPSCHA